MTNATGEVGTSSSAGGAAGAPAGAGAVASGGGAGALLGGGEYNAAVEQMVEMGIPANICESALRHCHGQLEQV